MIIMSWTQKQYQTDTQYLVKLILPVLYTILKFSVILISLRHDQIPLNHNDIPKSQNSDMNIFWIVRKHAYAIWLMKYSRDLSTKLGVIYYAFMSKLMIYLFTSKDSDEHYHKLKASFSKLEGYGLWMNVCKCTIDKLTIDFLGFRISENGIQLLPSW